MSANVSGPDGKQDVCQSGHIYISLDVEQCDDLHTVTTFILEFNKLAVKETKGFLSSLVLDLSVEVKGNNGDTEQPCD